MVKLIMLLVVVSTSVICSPLKRPLPASDTVLEPLETSSGIFQTPVVPPRTRPKRDHIVSIDVLESRVKAVDWELSDPRDILAAVNGLCQTAYGVSILERLDYLDPVHINNLYQLVSDLERVVHIRFHHKDTIPANVQALVNTILQWNEEGPGVIISDDYDEVGGLAIIMTYIQSSAETLKLESIIREYFHQVLEYTTNRLMEALGLANKLKPSPFFVWASLGWCEGIEKLLRILNDRSLKTVSPEVIEVVRRFEYITPSLLIPDIEKPIAIPLSSSSAPGCPPRLNIEGLDDVSIHEIAETCRNDSNFYDLLLDKVSERFTEWKDRLLEQTSGSPSASSV